MGSPGVQAALQGRLGPKVQQKLEEKLEAVLRTVPDGTRISSDMVKAGAQEYKQFKQSRAEVQT